MYKQIFFPSRMNHEQRGAFALLVEQGVSASR